MRILQRGPFAAVLILFAILALACGLGDKLKEQASEEVFEQALDQAGVDGNIDIDLGAAVDISDLPEWLNYPNAHATGKMTMSQDGAEGTMFVLTTDDPKDTVKTWYTTALSTWQQTASFDSEGGTQLVYTDGSTSTVQLTLAEAEGHTTISCWYAKGAEGEEPAVEVQQAVDPAKPHPRQGPVGPGKGQKVGPGKGIKAKRAGNK
ncbi:MAG: hypothetical protein ABIO70_02915 [Pseudomonadota bacterium]